MRSLRPILLIAALPFLFSAGCACEATPPSAGCTTSDECADNERCVSGQCRPVADKPDSGSLDPLDAGTKKDGGADINDPLNATKDSDCDGLSDAEEFSRTYGTERRRTDPDNADTDGDGLSDGLELGRTSSVGAGCDFTGDADPASQTDPTRADTDADGLSDGAEDRNHNGVRDPDETDPLRADTDSDLIPDALEDKNGNGAVDSGETSPLKADSDGDGLPDGIEDKNHDGQVDSGETNPANPDTDGDGCLDGLEDRNFNGRVDSGESNPLVPGDCTGQGFDTDKDGIPDAVELQTGTDPLNADTDGDRIKDGVEDRNRNGTVDPGESDPRNRDTDGDGLEDGIEDMNRDGQRQSNETDATKADTDGDGCIDGAEDPNGNHVVEYGETNPLQAGDCPPARKDTDCDGLTDAVEVSTTHTNPTNPDTDGDGIYDGRERGVVINPDPFFCPQPAFAANALDADPSSITDPTRADTDCDGLSDGAEDVNHNGKLDANETDATLADTDGDGLKDGLELGVTTNPDPAHCPGFTADQQTSTHTDPTDADTDGDGVPDGAEDINGNGRVDPGELDPLNPGDATGPVQACVNPRQIQTISRFDSDLQVVATSDFNTVTTLRQSGKEVGVMVYDPIHKVVGFALRQAPAASSAAAQETDGRAKINGVQALSSALTQLFTSWDNYPAMQAWYEQPGTGDLIARANAIVQAFLPGVSGTLGSNAGAVGPFKIQVEYLRRSGNRAMVVGAIAPKANASSTLLRVDDVANGSALAQFGDAHRPVCEKLTSATYPKVDFIWVVDNSGSMSAWQNEVANAAGAMGAQLAAAPIDWRIATIYTDTDRETTRKNQPRPFTRSITQFSQDAAPGAPGVSPERGFAPVNYMLQTGRWLPATAPGATEDPNKLRAGAKVVIIWLTDAREQSTTWPSVCNNAGSSCNHVDLNNPYINVPVGYASWSAYFQGLPGGLGKAFVAGIIPPVGVQMPGEETMTSEYRDVITSLQGIEADMRNTSATATAIEQIVTASIGQATANRLSKPPISSSIKVALAGPLVTQGGPGCNKNDLPRSREHGFDWDGASKTLVFYGDCRPNPSNPQTIAVSYRYWEDLTPNPDGNAPPCGGSCPSPLTCDPVSNTCVCPANCGGGCATDRVCDPASCACVCPPDCGGTCTGNLTCDTSSCSCRCQQNQSCGDGFSWDQSACACVCDLANLNCGPNEQIDADTCSCMCKPNCGGCGPGFTCNPDSCACECPANVTCTDGYALDRNSCSCVCDVTQLHCEEIGPNYEADPGSCSCACKPDCGGCEAGKRCDPSHCACRGGPS